MFKSLTLVSMISIGASTTIHTVDHSTPAINTNMIEEINSLKTTWHATVPLRFANASVAEVKMQLGTIMPGEEGYMPPENTLEHKLGAMAIPESFDVRTNWPQCSAITGRVRDQSNCGSCWTFGSTEAFNDRYCIAYNDAKTLFSAEDTNACCTGRECSFSMGCNGGQPSGAWNWFTKTGVSSGADWAEYEAKDGSSCKPYSMQSCAHHVTPPPGMVACDSVSSYSTPKCTSTCSDSNYAQAYSSDKHFAKSSYAVKGVEAMQTELMTKGTLSVALTVYEDFEAYSGGVYQHVTGKSLGGHAVKMVGWGVDNGTPYWTCVNSWNDSWGEKGIFRILRGKNECGIEGSVVAGDV